MIDEKKLIEDLLHDDGIEFHMDFKCDTEEEILHSIQEYTNKLKEGIVNLINAQPQIGFTSVKEGYPTKPICYLCRCIIDDHDDFPFYMVLRYHTVDENPHFQHEAPHGVHVTHWMPFYDPVDGSDPR